MNDLKTRVLFSWVFLLIIWPVGIFLAVTNAESNPIFTSFAPAFVSSFRRDLQKKAELKKKYVIGLLVVGSLLIELIKAYNLFFFAGIWRLFAIVILMLPALGWFVWDDVNRLVGKQEYATEGAQQSAADGRRD